eukprot:CAMPEP_0114581514 /NCGR_PEP_ID=MMETSP0125-20121206/5620_1 /TAXON_ID=485358 ORGANISM="Aristerostoma sp., Strain ATCC 50986" /NCGR_SAMPLE_ID=MMETSP0125 /ASSEMBLY_ACC=CAM_ASM_000245 /LENGTH=161 /DNA_ID=CAMNT_0001773793 /DNA_START=1181 /DNA_END=1666 /DNA_ORIENTATION=-
MNLAARVAVIFSVCLMYSLYLIITRPYKSRYIFVEHLIYEFLQLIYIIGYLIDGALTFEGKVNEDARIVAGFLVVISWLLLPLVKTIFFIYEGIWRVYRAKLEKKKVVRPQSPRKEGQSVQTNSATKHEETAAKEGLVNNDGNKNDDTTLLDVSRVENAGG